MTPWRGAKFLGFMVSGEGVRPLPSKIEAVLQNQVPETITHLRSFLGMCNFFRAHLPAFADLPAFAYGVAERKQK